MNETIQNEIQEIVHEINTLLPDAQVIIFGSYSTGKQLKDSDLDICIVAPKFPMRRLDMMDAILDAVCDKTTLPLDIMLFRSDEFELNSKMKPKIEYTIAREGVLLNA
ncbi:hypothetical protein FACS1894216_08300 [Synergistales bacterium]|nr:hypothetical protein FACS1894216_08300 [Synergistales bacterium]